MTSQWMVQVFDSFDMLISPMSADRYPVTVTGAPAGAARRVKGRARLGAFIELHVGASPAGARAAPPGLWTVVQWQDSLAAWHAVEGWQEHAIPLIKRRVGG